MERSYALGMNARKLNEMVDKFYNDEIVTEQVLANIELRAKEVIKCCEIERRERGFSKKESN